MPSLLLLESQELWILTMILSMFYFMFQFHIADTLGKEPQREKRELECSLSLLKLVLITRESQNLTFWWWLRAHKSKGWTAGETNRLTHSASCLLVYTYVFLHWATWCKHTHWHMEGVLLLELAFLAFGCSGSLENSGKSSQTLQFESLSFCPLSQ